MKKKIVSLIAGMSLICCVSPSEGPDRGPQVLTLEQATHHIPPGVNDPQGWAEDIIAALRTIDKGPTSERFCAVVAVIRQESNFHTDPEVPNLPQVVRQGLDKKFARLGVLAGPVVSALLEGHAPGRSESFGQRIAKLKTEGDLDRTFRDLAATYQAQLPGPYMVASALSMVLGKGSLEGLNPVTTAGSMQVKVSYAKSLPGFSGLTTDQVREQMYTRAGGVRAGTARLIDYTAPYADIIYRFADYNAGVYSSRNAAFQKMLADLTRTELALDGDILLYEDNGDAKSAPSKTMVALLEFGKTHDLSEWRLEHDAAKEKTEAFETTETYETVKRTWEGTFRRTAAYAMLPEVELHSPKLAKTRSTSWFATSVKKHYQECRARDEG